MKFKLVTNLDEIDLDELFANLSPISNQIYLNTCKSLEDQFRDFYEREFKNSTSYPKMTFDNFKEELKENIKEASAIAIETISYYTYQTAQKFINESDISNEYLAGLLRKYHYEVNSVSQNGIFFEINDKRYEIFKPTDENDGQAYEDQIEVNQILNQEILMHYKNLILDKVLQSVESQMSDVNFAMRYLTFTYWLKVNTSLIIKASFNEIYEHLSMQVYK